MEQSALIALRVALSSARQYTDKIAETLAGGLRYKGSVATSSLLPLTGNTLGDMYTCNDTGHEWVWTVKEPSGQFTNWLDLNKELENFYKKSEVDGLLLALKTELTSCIDTKQNIITDLTSIRDGARLGASSVQPSTITDMATKTWVRGEGYLTDGSFDNKTIVKDELGRFQTSIGGYKELQDTYHTIDSDSEHSVVFSNNHLNNMWTTNLQESENWRNDLRRIILKMSQHPDDFRLKITCKLRNAQSYTSVIHKGVSFGLGSRYTVSLAPEDTSEVFTFDYLIISDDGYQSVIENRCSALEERSLLIFELVEKISTVTYHPIDSRYLSIDNQTLRLNGNEIYADDMATQAWANDSKMPWLGDHGKIPQWKTEDPGAGYAFHIPYNFKLSSGMDNINIKVQTITADGNNTYDEWESILPAANSITSMSSKNAGLMTSDDATALRITIPAQLGGVNFRVLSQSDYDSLETKDPNTLYIIR